ncbi:MAG: class I tRNA ligase family protein, partial [Candidatus Aenigmarchaeota archaeon]|nr:class I tRNA ligase family protein [Candidatus Aenigmarchaeota archaeon]
MKFLPKLKEKQWDKLIEQQMFKKWQEEGLYKFDKKSKKPLYSIDTPPPYVNTPIHIGHAYTYVWQDIMARSRRMMGFNVLFPIGLDKNGLPIEVMAEKIFNIKMHETPREEFIAKCKEMLEKAGDASLDSFKRLGLSCNEWQVKYELG